MTLQDLDEIFRNLRSRSDGRLRLSRHRSKSDLAPWLIKVLMNTCCALLDGTFQHPVSLIASRFSLCTSPGSLDSYDDMIGIFNSVFSVEFMLLVLPLDQRPSVDKSCLPSLPTWPQVVSETQKKNCAKAYRDATTYSRPLTCAVCARERRDAEIKRCTIRDNCSSLPLHLDNLRITNPYIMDHTSSENPFVFGHPLLDNLMLTHDGIIRQKKLVPVQSF